MMSYQPQPPMGNPPPMGTPMPVGAPPTMRSPLPGGEAAGGDASVVMIDSLSFADSRVANGVCLPYSPERVEPTAVPHPECRSYRATRLLRLEGVVGDAPERLRVAEQIRRS